jgi:hypothetical protein
MKEVTVKVLRKEQKKGIALKCYGTAEEGGAGVCLEGDVGD